MYQGYLEGRAHVKSEEKDFTFKCRVCGSLEYSFLNLNLQGIPSVCYCSNCTTLFLQADKFTQAKSSEV